MLMNIWNPPGNALHWQWHFTPAQRGFLPLERLAFQFQLFLLGIRHHVLCERWSSSTNMPSRVLMPSMWIITRARRNAQPEMRPFKSGEGRSISCTHGFIQSPLSLSSPSLGTSWCRPPAIRKACTVKVQRERDGIDQQGVSTFSELLQLWINTKMAKNVCPTFRELDPAARGS